MSTAVNTTDPDLPSYMYPSVKEIDTSVKKVGWPPHNFV